MVLKVGTDCSGIEAPIEALKQMKIPFKQVFACEIDVYARKSIEANYHCEKTYLDITKRDISTVPNLDMYICGFPCQAFSTIGNRKGTRDSRGTIFNYCLLLIKKKKPKIFILENVKGLLSIQNGETFKQIIQELTDLKDYAIYYKILNTKDYGIPQNRPRVYIVGLLKKYMKKDFQFPSTTPCKKHFIDTVNKRDTLSERCNSLFKKIDKPPIFVNLNTLGLNYKNNPKYYCSCLDTLGKIWCYPKHRWATCKEYLCLQGFPKNFKQVVSDSQLKKQIGNSMSVNVLKCLFKECFRALGLFKF